MAEKICWLGERIIEASRVSEYIRDEHGSRLTTRADCIEILLSKIDIPTRRKLCENLGISHDDFEAFERVYQKLYRVTSA